MATSANKLFVGDNLDVMRGLNSGSVDLIYLDPPFNSKRIYSAPIGVGKGTKKKEVLASFHDIWNWNDDVDERLLAYADKHADLFSYIQVVGNIHGAAMKAYLTFMAQRIVEMHRVLKESGSLYLHCDPTASHYLKLILDSVFGKHNCRNEIIWCYPPGGKGPKFGFHRKHDVIHYYGKDNVGVFHRPYTEVTESAAAKFTSQDSQGRRYKSYPGGRSYLDEAKGRPLPDWWTDIHSLGQTISKERTGYPTQKPLALLNRIIQASSNQGDVVLDPFCGCATTCVAAQNLHRNWIGIDVSDVAVALVSDRLNYTDDAKNLFTDFDAVNTLPTRTDLKKFDWSKAKVRKHFYGEQAGNCNGCRTHFDHPRHFHIDHIYPDSKGGQWQLDNLQLLCGNCNSIKGDRPMEYLNAALKARSAKIHIY